MPLDPNRARQHLKRFDFRALLIEEMGWDHHAQTLEVVTDRGSFHLNAVAQKRGLVAFLCDPPPDGHIPDYPMRRRIETQVVKSVHEHIIVYVDRDKTAQVWQWVRREPGKPAACRERAYHAGQTGDPLIQRLQAVAFSLEEEESLTIVDVTGRARAAFDVERITKRFYDRFKTEHAAFLKFIKGIPDDEMQRWYASVMINRLMFIYFIQKKGFLDDNRDYLGSKLAETKKRGKNLFYREFLCALFFKGFAVRKRSAETTRLLGNVPYLNGGLFLRHQIEELHDKTIVISDAAFEKLFEFFDTYQWHLDERQLRNDQEINPDVLGYIFEKYINQKQMGAYYTKEDITEYISKNTIIPCLFDKARQKCKIAFEGETSVWRILQANPDRYIYDAVKKGVDLPLPAEIASGLDDVSKRSEWNKPAPAAYALPTETWREVVARRKRYEEVRGKLASGEVHNINDLITYNLDIRQFAQDVIVNSEGPELLRAFWRAIVGRIPERSNEGFENGISVLDPTCGSGAFLFAALNVLEPLYDACLDRMQVFLDDLDRSGERYDPKKFGDFRKVLGRVDQHPNHRYFVLKSIVINNLFGVDIMEEAVEICKLRLFLKLVAQVERGEQIEPLPDIDLNIRAGNTLVGYATYDDVKQAVTSKLDFENSMARIEEKAEDIDGLFNRFRQQQTALGGEVTPADKQDLRKRLKALDEDLNV
ncbi:MAG TPA: SAM-dependent methyltransferase, partial [Blastocatellia bacterium]|nr:SAM-dependent methyltransferase [Blastocatellia bacterium]